MNASFDDGPRFEARGAGIIALLRLVREGVAARVAGNSQLNGAEEDLLRALAMANRAVFTQPFPDCLPGNGDDADDVIVEYVATSIAAQLLNRTPRRVRQLAVNEDVLRSRRVGGRIEVALADVERLLEDRA